MKRKEEEVSDHHQHAEMMIHWTDSTKRRKRESILGHWVERR